MTVSTPISSSTPEPARPHLQVADATQLHAQAEAEAWARFTGADSIPSFCRGWLGVTAVRVGASEALLVMATVDRQRFVPAALWPENKRARAPLQGVIERAMASNALVAAPTDNPPNRIHVAQPIHIDGQVMGAVAVEMPASSQSNLTVLAQDLSWSVGWIEALLRRRLLNEQVAANARLRQVLDVFSAALEHEGFEPAATAAVTELAALLGCERAALGTLKGEHAQVRAVSNTVQFANKAELIRLIEAAMDESLDQNSLLRYPAPQGTNGGLVLFAHEKLTQTQSNAHMVTLPIHRNGEHVGALSLQRARDFEPGEIALIEGIGALLGPLVDVQQLAERSAVARVRDSIKALRTRFFGPGFAAWKLGGIIAVLLVLFFSLVSGEFRVTADMRIEGSVQRAISAPFEGYVREAKVRPGDTVKEGDVIARLDDRDLQLETLKVDARRAQAVNQYREALANADRAQITVIGAQVEQADAELAVAQEKLTRSVLVAPFNGVIVSGDLSQQLGAPVQRGQVLFEIAPLEDYRVVLKVDEGDIRQVAEGQRGELVLASMPGTRLPFKISRITPVSTAEDGKNFFRVEAKLEQGAERLRPGMEGIAKVQAGERKLIWIWTRHLTDWLRLKLWWLAP